MGRFFLKEFFYFPLLGIVGGPGVSHFRTESVRTKSRKIHG